MDRLAKAAKYLLVVGAFLVACSGAQSVPADAQVTIISLTKIDCADCGDEIVQDLRSRPGVYKALFDRKNAEISVTASPSFDVFMTVRKLAAAEGFEAVLGAGKGHYLEWGNFPQGADVKTVAKGGVDVPDLAGVVVKGKVTVVDFSAIWCKPCRLVDQHMAQVMKDRTDLAYRKMDVGDWDTPLAQRYLKNVPQLPYVVVYGRSGQKVGEIVGADLAKLDVAIAQGAGP